MAMKVSELIEKLAQCDPDALVFSGVAYDNGTSFTNVSRVSKAGAYLVEQSFMGDYYEPRSEFECSCGEHEEGESCPSNTGLVEGVFIE